MSEMSLRQAQILDQVALLALVQEYYSFEDIHISLKTTSLALGQLLSSPALGNAFFIEQDKEIAGYVIMTNGFSLEYGGVYQFIDELFIREPFRHQGLGTKALNHLEEWSFQNGAASIHLEVERNNTRAQAFYTALGYRDEGRYLWNKRLGPQ